MSKWTRNRKLRCLTVYFYIKSFVFQQTEEVGQQAARRLVMHWGKRLPL